MGQLPSLGDFILCQAELYCGLVTEELACIKLITHPVAFPSAPLNNGMVVGGTFIRQPGPHTPKGSLPFFA